MYNDLKKFRNNADGLVYFPLNSNFGGSNYHGSQSQTYSNDFPNSLLDSPRTVVGDDEEDDLSLSERRQTPVLSERQAESTAYIPPPPSASTIYDKSFLQLQQQSPPLVYMSSHDPMTPELAHYLDTLWNMQHAPPEVCVSPLDVVRQGATYQYNPDPSHLSRNYREAIAPFTTSPFIGEATFSDADGSPYTSPIIKYEEYNEHHNVPLFGGSVYDRESDAKLQDTILCGMTPKVEASPSSFTATPVISEPHGPLSIDTALTRTADTLFSPSPATAVKQQVSSPDSSDAYEEDEEPSEEDDYQPHRSSTRGNAKRNVRDTYTSLPGSPPTASRPRRSGVATSPLVAGAARRLRFVRAPTARTDTGRAGMIDPTKEHNFRCRFECPDYFTSAYECKRHQEDHHAKHQAQELIASFDRGVQHFTLGNMHWILLAGTRGSSRNSSYQRETFNNILKKYHFVQEKSIEERMSAEEVEARWETVKHNLDQYIEGKVVQQVLDFARSFVQKYVCPSCGLDFSRTDSKQRHMAHNHRS